jgi:hypothetical protein
MANRSGQAAVLAILRVADENEVAGATDASRGLPFRCSHNRRDCPRQTVAVASSRWVNLARHHGGSAVFRWYESTKLLFKSHSSQRPPQTPAASFLSPYRKRLGSEFTASLRPRSPRRFRSRLATIRTEGRRRAFLVPDPPNVPYDFWPAL